MKKKFKDLQINDIIFVGATFYKIKEKSEKDGCLILICSNNKKYYIPYNKMNSSKAKIGKNMVFISPKVWHKYLLRTAENYYNDYQSALIAEDKRLTNLLLWPNILNCSNPIDVSKVDTSGVRNMIRTFCDCRGIETLDLSNFDTSKITDMSWIFRYCSSLAFLNLSNFDTSNVTDMRYMFFECKKLASLDLSNFDTSKVKRMDLMFDNCCDLTSLNLSNFDTSKVTDMSWMFYKCMSLASLDISSFNFTSTVATDNMFCLCKSLTDLKFGKNLKKPLNFRSCPLTHESALSVINGLAKVEQRQTIFFSEPTYDTLSKEDIKLAEDKKWSIEQY